MEKGNKLYHFLDKWMGIPIVFLLGLFSKKRKFPDIVKEIAVINLASIGDSVLMSAIIADIKHRYPSGNLVAFVGGTNFELVKLIEGVNRIERITLKNPVSSLLKVRKHKPVDLFIDFGQWPRINAIYSFFIRAKYKIGFKKTGQFRHYVYDKTIEHSDDIHELNNFRNLIASFYSNALHNPKINIICNEKAKDFINKSKRYCIIHAWSGGLRADLKQWPNQRWGELIGRIKDDFDFIFITGSTKDIANSEKILNLVKAHTHNVYNIAGLYSLNEMICIINHAALLITIDTGIAHIAAALNKTQICIIRYVFHSQWNPWSDNAHIVFHEYSDIPNKDTVFKKEVSNEYCLENISVDIVYKKYQEIKSR